MWAARVVAITLLLGSVPLRGQTVRPSAVPLDADVEIALPALEGPSLVVIDARRTPAATPGGKATGDATLWIDGDCRGKVSLFQIGRDVFRAHLPIDVVKAGRGRRPVLKVKRDAPGLRVGPIKVVRAGVLEVNASDGRLPGLPAILDIVSASGEAPPLFGFLPHSPHAGSATLVRGRQRVVVPAGVQLKLMTWTHPFSAPARQTVTVRRGGRIGLQPQLGKDLRPPNADLWTAPLAAAHDGASNELRDVVLGVSSRSAPPATVAAEMVGVLPELFLLRLLEKGALPPVVTDQSGPSGLPAGPRTVRTLRLEGGRLLHSNGPVLTERGVFRDKATGHVGRVLASLGIQ